MADLPGAAARVGEPADGGTARGPQSLSTWLAARLDLVLRLGLFIIILIEVAYFTIATMPSGGLSKIGQSTFISQGNLQDIGTQMAVFGVLALGETFVIITAGIDLSVGSMVGITGVICAEEMTGNIPVPVVIITVLLFGVAIGLINGTLVGVARFPHSSSPWACWASCVARPFW
jgi:ribose/xylose/arabinose/galactoside ABC-type transport system permease subunit